MLTPCREWSGTRLSKPGFEYGRIRRDGRTWYVHRWVWTLANGPIPDGLCVLHRCDNPPCFRLDHLFLGTVGDNARDMTAKGRNPSTTRTHCPQGHAYDEVNTYVTPDGRRMCRSCNRAAWHRWKARSMEVV